MTGGQDLRDAYDVVVVGGGSGGLAGAVALARSLRTVLVVDDGTPRNAPAEGVHNYLGREGTPPRELFAQGRRELAGYGGEAIDGQVVDARAEPGPQGRTGFLVDLADGRRVRARRLLVATGLRDELPDVEGLAAHWGRYVVHCPYCHGYEHRGAPIGVLATGPLTLHQSLLFSQLSDDVIVFRHTAAPFSAQQRALLDARGVRVVEGEVVALETGPDGVPTGVRMASGELVARRVLAVTPGYGPRVEGVKGLGLTTVEQEIDGVVIGTVVQADATGLTDVPGVWVAGNVAQATAQVVVSAGAGLGAGAKINYDLILEDAGQAGAAAAG